MSTHPAFKAACETLDWGHEAIKELAPLLEQYAASSPCAVVTRRDCMVLVVKDQPPSEARRKSSEAITGIRHAFDQILYAAELAIGGQPGKKHNMP